MIGRKNKNLLGVASIVKIITFRDSTLDIILSLSEKEKVVEAYQESIEVIDLIDRFCKLLLNCLKEEGYTFFREWNNFPIIVVEEGTKVDTLINRIKFNRS